MRTIVRRERVGVVFQDFNLHPGLDVAHNITLPALIAGQKPDEDWLDRVVTRLGLGDLLDRRPAELSGGEQQRAAAARALARRPRLLLADEPTGNLDRRAGRELLDILRIAVDEFEQTVVLATHDLAGACLGDRAVLLGDGRVVDMVDAPSVASLSDLVRSAGINTA
jgi:putative ABC transport system ATP-binding protein